MSIDTFYQRYPDLADYLASYSDPATYRLTDDPSRDAAVREEMERESVQDYLSRSDIERQRKALSQGYELLTKTQPRSEETTSALADVASYVARVKDPRDPPGLAGVHSWLTRVLNLLGSELRDGR